MSMETKRTEVYNLIILDKSGSMESIRQAAIDGYNETLGSIKAAQQKYAETQKHYISLALFCGCGVEMVYGCVEVEKAEKLTKELYNPCCMTPLYDAIGKSVKALAKRVDAAEDGAALVTIITDGCENASQEWTGQAIKKLIEERKEEGWVFSYIGADHDIEAVASSISVTNVMSWTKTDEGTQQMINTEIKARNRFFAKMSSCCKAELTNEYRKQIAQEYYKEDEEL